MKDPYKILRLKQTELSRVKAEVEALGIVAPLLSDEADSGDETLPVTTRWTASPRPIQVPKGANTRNTRRSGRRGPRVSHSLGRYYLPQIHMVHKGLADWLTSGDYFIRGHMRVYLVKLPTSRLVGTDPHVPICFTSDCYRVDDFLPGLLANHEMTQRSNPALSKPVNRKSLQGCITK